MMTTCSRRIQFCAGHRVMGHENKCAHLHGHNYVAIITATADELDSVGRVIDFSVLKAAIGGWIEKHWDHGFILHERDEQARRIVEAFEVRPGQRQKCFLMPTNPTAENMAAYLLNHVAVETLLDSGVRVTGVELWETENCKAVATA